MTKRNADRDVSAQRKTVELTSNFGMGTINYYDGYLPSLVLPLRAVSFVFIFYQKSHKTRHGDFDSRGSIAEKIVSNSPFATAVASKRRKTRKDPNVQYILLLLSYKCDGRERERERRAAKFISEQSYSARPETVPIHSSLRFTRRAKGWIFIIIIIVILFMILVTLSRSFYVNRQSLAVQSLFSLNFCDSPLLSCFAVLFHSCSRSGRDNAINKTNSHGIKRFKDCRNVSIDA